VRITGQPTATTFTFTVRGTDFFAAGTQRSTACGAGTLQADGSFTATGRGRYVGGTVAIAARGAPLLRGHAGGGLDDPDRPLARDHPLLRRTGSEVAQRGAPR
jgi:hypothetical protein